MAKRVPPDEQPYNPVEESLVRNVMNPRVPVDVSHQERQATIEELRKEPEPQSLKSTRREAKPAPRLTREKRVLLTQAEERQIELLVARLAMELSTPVKLSHLLRACVALLRHAEQDIARRARQAAPLSRPPNSNPEALADFQDQLSRLLLEAFRETAPL